MNISKSDILSILDKLPNQKNCTLLKSLINTDTDLLEILNCNPIILSTLIEHIYLPNIIYLLHEIIISNAQLTNEHRTLLKYSIMNYDLNKIKTLQLSVYLMDEDMEFINYIFSRIEEDEKYYCIGFQIINKVFMQNSNSINKNKSVHKLILSNLIQRRSKILKDTLLMIMDEYIELIYLFRKEIYEVIKDTGFYVVLYRKRDIKKFEMIRNDIVCDNNNKEDQAIAYSIRSIKQNLFKEDFHIIFNIVDNKKKFLLNIKIENQFINEIFKYNFKSIRLLLKIFKSSKDKLEVIDYVTSQRINDFRLTYHLINYLLENNLPCDKFDNEHIRICKEIRKEKYAYIQQEKNLMDNLVDTLEYILNMHVRSANLVNDLYILIEIGDYLINMQIQGIEKVSKSLLQFIACEDIPFEYIPINEYCIQYLDYIIPKEDLDFYIFKFIRYMKYKHIKYIYDLLDTRLYSVLRYITEYIRLDEVRIDTCIVFRNIKYVNNDVVDLIREMVIKRYNIIKEVFSILDKDLVSVLKYINKIEILKYIDKDIQEVYKNKEVYKKKDNEIIYKNEDMQVMYKNTHQRNNKYVKDLSLIRKIIKEIIIPSEEYKEILYYLLRFISNGLVDEYIFEVARECVIVVYEKSYDDKLLIFYLHLCEKFGVVPYDTLKYIKSKKEYYKGIRIMKKNLLNLRLLKEYKYVCRLDDKYYDVYFKNIEYYNYTLLMESKDLYSTLIYCYECLLRETSSVRACNKLGNIIRKKLGDIFEYKEIYFILDKLYKYKNVYVIDKIKVDLVKCIGLDREVDEYIKKLLLLIF